MKIPSTLRFLYVVVAAFLSACNTLPKPQPVADTTSLYVWPQSACPSEAAHAVFLGAVGLQLGSDVVSGLVGVLASALNSAAAADKNGYQMITNSAVFYDYVQYDSGKNAYTLASPSCYVVAVAKPAKSAQSWCSDVSFNAAMPKSCSGAGSAVIDNLAANPSPSGDAEVWPLALPSFYAEIGLNESIYSGSPSQFKVVTPTIDAMYYPHPLMGAGVEEGKLHHLSIAITFVNPSIGTGQSTGGSNVTDFFKGADVAIDLLGVTPGPKIDLQEVDSNLHTAWTSVPIDTIPSRMAYKGNISGPFKPISVSATLHEVGDPGVFMQAFAAAFGAQSLTTAITNAIAGAVLPPSAATDAQSKSTYQSAQSKYLAAVSSYQTACVKQQTDVADGKSGSSTVAKSRAAVPADDTALESTKVGADAAYAAWQAAQLQAGGAATKEEALHCP
jgi:hypothetical protein